jgi:hypothetical protein
MHRRQERFAFPRTPYSDSSDIPFLFELLRADQGTEQQQRAVHHDQNQWIPVSTECLLFSWKQNIGNMQERKQQLLGRAN